MRRPWVVLVAWRRSCWPLLRPHMRKSRRSRPTSPSLRKGSRSVPSPPPSRCVHRGRSWMSSSVAAEPLRAASFSTAPSRFARTSPVTTAAERSRFFSTHSSTRQPRRHAIKRVRLRSLDEGQATTPHSVATVISVCSPMVTASPRPLPAPSDYKSDGTGVTAAKRALVAVTPVRIGCSTCGALGHGRMVRPQRRQGGRGSRRQLRPGWPSL
jgi:hypothetical protein